MSKKLKIQFWKAEKALAMQILEQEGLRSYKEDGEVLIWDQPTLYENSIDLRGRAKWANLAIPHIEFDTNAERDEYLRNAVNAITDELFAGDGELKVGEMCEVKDYDDKRWGERKLIAILPEQYKPRFIVEVKDYPTMYASRDCARAIAKSTEPKIEECGQLVTYTWEEK